MATNNVRPMMEFVYDKNTCSSSYQLWIIQLESYCFANGIDPSNNENDKAMAHTLISMCSVHQLKVLQSAFGPKFNEKHYQELKTVLDQFDKSIQFLFL